MTIIYITERIKANALVWSSHKEGAVTALVNVGGEKRSLLFPLPRLEALKIESRFGRLL